jgi:hypothetical protein
MRPSIAALTLLLAPLSLASAHDRVRLEVGLPHLSIGLRAPVFAGHVQVPGHPVAYDPRVSANLFWFDDRYWELRGDDWFSASPHGGPWLAVAPGYVPAALLGVPVRYYRSPPAHFAGWHLDAAPRWHDHWSHGRRGGDDRGWRDGRFGDDGSRRRGRGGDDGWRSGHGRDGGRHDDDGGRGGRGRR